MEQALNHIWIKSMAATAKAMLNDATVTHMQAFTGLRKLKKAILMYVATQTSEKESSALRQLFVALDKDGDGRLSRAEMEEALTQFKGKLDLKALSECIDTDKSGFIDYTGSECLRSSRVLGRDH